MTTEELLAQLITEVQGLRADTAQLYLEIFQIQANTYRLTQQVFWCFIAVFALLILSLVWQYVIWRALRP